MKDFIIKKYEININNNDFVAVFTGAHGIANDFRCCKRVNKTKKVRSENIIYWRWHIRLKEEKKKNNHAPPFLEKNELSYVLKNYVGLMNLDNIEDFIRHVPNNFDTASGFPSF